MVCDIILSQDEELPMIYNLSDEDLCTLVFFSKYDDDHNGGNDVFDDDAGA